MKNIMAKTMYKHLFVIILFAGLPFRGVADLSLYGILKIKGYNVISNHFTRKNMQINYEVIRGTNQWLIEHDFIRNARHRWFYDGTNLYDIGIITEDISVDDKNKLETAFGIGVNRTSKSNMGSIYIYDGKTAIPQGEMGVNLPWMIFCSGAFSPNDQNPRVIPNPLCDIQSSPEAFGHQSKITRYEDAVGMVKMLELYIDRKILWDSLKSRGFVTEKYPSMYWINHIRYYRDGDLKFRYKCLVETNKCCLAIPISYEYTCNDYNERGQFLLKYSGFGVVTNIECVQTGMEQALFSERKYSIVDKRYVNQKFGISGIIYPYDHYGIRETNDPVLNKIYNAALKRPNIPRNRPNNYAGPHLAKILFTLILGMMPFLVYFWKKRKTSPVCKSH